MEMSNLFRFACLCVAVLISIPTAARAQEILQAGQSYEFRPWDTQCFALTQGDRGVLPQVSASCDTSTGEADVTLASNGSLLALEMEAHTRFQKWIVVEPVANVPQQSLVPVHFRIPRIAWKVNMLNDVIVQFFGYAAVNILFTVRKDPVDPNPGLDNPQLRGTIVEQRRVLAASHGGIGVGCLVSSIAAVATAKPGSIFKCVAGISMRLKDQASVSTTVLLEPGSTYNVEITFEAFASKTVNAPQNLNFVSIRSPLDPSLDWGRMFVSVGTDPQAAIADLQEQIDELWEALEGHTHEYLTGRGEGHNNVEAETSTMLQDLGSPADDEPGSTGGSTILSTEGAVRSDQQGVSGGGGSDRWLWLGLLPIAAWRRWGRNQPTI